MEFINLERALELWSSVKYALEKKQDKLTGTAEQMVGFDENGKQKAYTMGLLEMQPH